MIHPLELGGSWNWNYWIWVSTTFARTELHCHVKCEVIGCEFDPLSHGPIVWSHRTNCWWPVSNDASLAYHPLNPNATNNILGLNTKPPPITVIMLKKKWLQHASESKSSYFWGWMLSPLLTNIMWSLLVIISLDNFIHFKIWNWWPPPPKKKLCLWEQGCHVITEFHETNIHSPRCALNASNLCRKGKGGPPRPGALPFWWIKFEVLS